MIKEIENDLINPDLDLSNILRKVKIYSSKLKLAELRSWTNYELNGYSQIPDIPSYRIYQAQNYGTFSGSFGSMMKNVVLPTYNLPDVVREFAEQMTFRESIKELESMLIMEGDKFIKNWPQEALILSRESLNLDGYVLVSAWQYITKSMISGILDSVKNRLLDFLLDLENCVELDTTIDSIDKIPKENMKEIFIKNFTIVQVGNNNRVNQDSRDLSNNESC